MHNKSSVLKKKYEIAVKKKFSFYCYFPTSKAKDNSKIIRNIALINLKILTIPSKFKLVQDQNVQNPQVFLIYTQNLNFKQIGFLNEQVITSFLVENKWYSPLLLKEANAYKNSQNVCQVFVNNVTNASLMLLSFFLLNLTRKSSNLKS